MTDNIGLSLAAPSRALGKPMSAPSAPSASNLDKTKTQIRQKAEEFESIYLTTFIEQMFAGLKTDGPFGGGHAEKIYRSMMAEQYASHLAKSGGIGLADHIYRELLKAQHIKP